MVDFVPISHRLHFHYWLMRICLADCFQSLVSIFSAVFSCRNPRYF
ncbi:hypothetical protein HMPREF3226_02506 [Prevotella corporis]|uniref:Uncharacterized protein n=1 Tax=Prevotella corporis TaxID=28128 RepID=A0A133PVP0_9BACT|nr:hypothetical protein HMPREF3226_02506 [Prevotella corporis]